MRFLKNKLELGGVMVFSAAIAPLAFEQERATYLLPPGACALDPEEVWERWTSIPLDGIGWTLIYYNASMPRLAPALPACPAQGAYLNVIGAATAWNTPGEVSLLHEGAHPAPVLDSVMKFDPSPSVAEFDEEDHDTLLTAAAPNYVVFINDTANAIQAGGAVFANLGGDYTLAITKVYTTISSVNCGPGVGICLNITGFDIALNATTEGGVPFWSWVADDGTTLYASHTLGQPAKRVPKYGYADIQGVLTHEFGHAAGLAHSVVDAKRVDGLSFIPTMFPFAQTDSFTSTLWVGNACVNPTVSYSPSNEASHFGGILGKSARTLEADDIASINRAYPDGSFDSKYGTISGTVPAPGLSVVAVSAASAFHYQPGQQDSNPQCRIGVLSYDYFNAIPGNPEFGPPYEYVLSGLPPGDYYIFAESIVDTQYLSQGDLPSYVEETAYPSNCTPAIGGLPPAAFNSLPIEELLREVYNVNDTGNEKGQLCDVVTVIEGLTVSANVAENTFGSGSHGPRLRIHGSFRGAVVSAYTETGPPQPPNPGDPAPAPTKRTVQFEVLDGPASRPVEILLSYSTTATPDSGHLREVGGGLIPLDGDLSLGGIIMLPYTIDPATQTFVMIHAQARVELSSGEYLYTNPVSLFVGSKWASP